MDQDLTELLKVVAANAEAFSIFIKEIAGSGVVGMIMSPVFQVLKQLLPKSASKGVVRLALFLLSAISVESYAYLSSQELLEPKNVFLAVVIFGVASLMYPYTAKEATKPRASA